MASSVTTPTRIISKQVLSTFLTSLSAKQPTPGGGASAAVSAAIGTATAQMAANYTQRKTGIVSGSTEKAHTFLDGTSTSIQTFLQAADDDVNAYAGLLKIYRKKRENKATCAATASAMEQEMKEMEARALAVPVRLVELCHQSVLSIQSFLPHCNPRTVSDAKAGIHQLAGAARAAYQTALANNPNAEQVERLALLLKEIRCIEDEVLELK